MATKSDIDLLSKNWTNRISQAVSLGLPKSSWETLLNRDVQQVIQTGASPMDDKTVSDAMLGSIKASPVATPSRKHTGPLDIIGNIPGDLQNFASSIPAGIVNFATTLPEEMANLKDLAVEDPQTIKELGFETTPGMKPGHTDITSLEGLGATLRNVTKVPVLSSLIPGIHTAAALTTPEGRQQLEEHPATTLVDVGSAIAMLGGVGAFGRSEYGAAEKAALESGATRPEAFRAASEMSPQTATEALQRGQPYKAVGRAIIGPGVDPITGEAATGLRAPIRRATANFAKAAGFHPESERIARALNETQARQQVDMSAFLATPVMQDLTKGLSNDDRQLLGRVAHRIEEPGDVAAFQAKPELGSLLERARAESERMAAENPNLIPVKSRWGGTYKYHKDSVVGRAQIALDTANEAATTLRQQAADASQQALDNWNRFGLADQRTSDATAIANELDKKAKSAAGKAVKAQTKLNTSLVANAPANFFAALGKRARSAGIRLAQEPGRFTEEQLPQVIADITNSGTWEQFRQALGDTNAANRIQAEVESTWSNLAKANIHAGAPDPIFLPNVPESNVRRTPYPTVMADVRNIKTNVSKATEFNLSRSVYDVAIGLTDNQRQLLEEWGTNHFINEVLRPRHVNDPLGVVRTESSKWKEVQDAILNGQTGAVDVRSQIQQEIYRTYVEWPADRFGGLRSYFPDVTKEGDKLLIPKSIDRSLQMLGFNRAYGPFHAAFDKATGLWRFTVLSTPRHISHVILGGLSMGLLRQPGFVLETATHLKQALGILRGRADPELKAMLGRNLNDFAPEQIIEYAGGKTMGRLLATALKPFDAINRMEENVTLMYKVMTMQHLESRVGRDEAMRIANKVFVDVNGMTPLERSVFKKVFPFYSFTRHVMRYALTYPADHPLRASILGNFSEQQQKDWDSGLPQAMQWMFYLGPPDADGIVDAVDYRSIDPFRSFYNNFTLAGITSQLNPMGQFLAQQAGVNTLSATPELYPGRHIDPVTGTFVADRPSGVALSALESMIPETQALDAMFSLSDQFRNLKISDPEAFRHRVYTALGIPFGPETITLPRKRQNYQMKLYQDASDAINTAVRTGDFEKAKQYNAVPTPSLFSNYFPGQPYVDPRIIESIYTGLSKLYPGVSLHAVLPHASTSKKIPSGIIGQ